MKVSLNWLQNYVKTTLTPSELAEGLTDLGLECTYEKYGNSFSNVVVGEVTECNPHENSDHLFVCKVQVDKKSSFNVVCGAQNVRSGILVPFAKIGATLDFGKFKIKETKIRGIISEGMICSERELGLGDNHEGIMILDDKHVRGSDFRKTMNLEEDIIYDIDLTPNRGDCLGHLGVARELAILEKKRIEKSDYESIEFKKAKVKEKFAIKISSQNNCKRYAACIIKGVKVKESPPWLKENLESIGQKSINNIIDAANYILMDLGHPMHTFDLDKIKSSSIDVRCAKKGEEIVTLDGVKQSLSTNNLLICDGSNPIAIAGIIGGNNSGIDEKTTNILIESAYFNPVNIRKSSKQLGISTEASKRFERDTDIDILIPALNKLCAIILELAGGETVPKIFDIYPRKSTIRKISFNIKKCNQFLGSEISLQSIKNIFDSLNILYDKKSDSLECTIPSFRNDLNREVDLYEEVARVFGYNNIDNSSSCAITFSSFVADERNIDSQIRLLLSSNGFNEQYSNSLLNKKEIDIAGIEENSIMISNPLNKEMEYLRNSLFCGLMKAVKFNENRQEKLFKLFEIGAIHFSNNFTKTGTSESFSLGLVWYGEECDNWSNKDCIDFYYAKGEVSHLLQSIGIDNITFKEDNSSEGFDVLCNIYLGKNHLGYIGVPNKKNKSQFAIKGSLLFSELNIDSIKKSINKKDSKISSWNYFPFINRDISILVSKEVKFSDIEKLILSTDNTILKGVRLFDLYEDNKLDENKKSMSFRMKFQSIERTLKDEEVDVIINKIVDKLKNKFDAVQR